MLPQSYQVPAALVLVLGGAVACFAGHRLFRAVLGFFGFVIGAMFASSIMGITNTVGMVVAAIVGGLLGALILVFAYFVGIALVGAGLGALVAHAAWSQLAKAEPPALAVIALAILGAAGAMVLQRYVIIAGTAFGGAWTLLVGALALAGDRAALHAAAAGNVWILYPLAPAPGQRWVSFVWVALGVIGAAVQLRVTDRNRKR